MYSTYIHSIYLSSDAVSFIDLFELEITYNPVT